MTTPTLAARTWPRITHAGSGTWHTMCETCGQTVQGNGVGGAASAHAMHVTKAHGLNRDADGYCLDCGEPHEDEACPIWTNADQQSCERCDDRVHYLSSDGLCDGCTAYNAGRVTL